MTRTRSMPGLALLAAGLAFGASPALAQSHRLTAAWDAAISEEAGYLEPAQRAELNAIAHHAAVAKLCEGFPVDVEKVAAATNAVVAAATAGLADTALIDRHTDILLALGTAHGLFLAEGSLHLDRFCAEAADTRADPEFAHYWE